MSVKYSELRTALDAAKAFGSNCSIVLNSADIHTLLAERDALRKALAHLVQGYVNTLESGRDRIVELGGQCDPLDVMEAADPYLRAARAALTPQETEE